MYLLENNDMKKATVALILNKFPLAFGFSVAQIIQIGNWRNFQATQVACYHYLRGLSYLEYAE